MNQDFRDLPQHIVEKYRRTGSTHDSMSLDSSKGSLPDYKQDTIRGPQTPNRKEKEDLGLSTTLGYKLLRGESLPLTIDDLTNLIRNVVRTT